MWILYIPQLSSFMSNLDGTPTNLRVWFNSLHQSEFNMVWSFTEINARYIRSEILKWGEESWERKGIRRQWTVEDRWKEIEGGEREMVCVCVCVREREREKEREIQIWRYDWHVISMYIVQATLRGYSMQFYFSMWLFCSSNGPWITVNSCLLAMYIKKFKHLIIAGWNVLAARNDNWTWPLCQDNVLI